jgi:hypothetical protein
MMDIGRSLRDAATIRAAVEKQISLIKGKRRRNAKDFGSWAEVPARRLVYATSDDPAPDGLLDGAEATLAAVRRFESLMKALKSNPDLEGALKPLLHKLSGQVYAGIRSLAAPVSEIVSMWNRHEAGKRRQ